MRSVEYNVYVFCMQDESDCDSMCLFYESPYLIKRASAMIYAQYLHFVIPVVIFVIVLSIVILNYKNDRIEKKYLAIQYVLRRRLLK